MIRALVLLGLVLTSCGTGLHPTRIDSSGGLLDLRSWDFSQGAVVPEGWLWDPDVLWSPSFGGRPSGLPPSLSLGAPDGGGAFVRTLMRPYSPEGRPEVRQATARIRILVPPGRNYGLQIGAIPGAFRVWVNGTKVWETGHVSTNPRTYRSDGVGTLVTVQARDGLLDLVVQIATSDPLIRHSELNRLWFLGPAEEMMSAERGERNWRSLQATFLVLGILIFFWVAYLRKDRWALAYFILFLVVCLFKLVANVEQPEPLLAGWFPWVPLSAYLFLNHGLNLLPFPILVLFLARQFPHDVGKVAQIVAVALTAVVTLWELLPFVVLSLGWEELYSTIMASQWTLVLNLYVVLGTLFIFERFYQIFQKKRPLAHAFFYGGVGMGVMILLPVPLSYFLPVKYTYFLGWGMFFFLFVLSLELIRLQVKTSESEFQALATKLDRQRSLSRFVSRGWASLLGRESLESLSPADTRTVDVVAVAMTGPEDVQRWLGIVGPLASSRRALLVDFREGVALWVLEVWSESALAFALEVQKATAPLAVSIALTKAQVEARILDLEAQWVPDIVHLPRGRLEGLLSEGKRLGVPLILDASLQDGLVIGGWRRHRQLNPEGTEIELYEAEDEDLAQMKDKTLEAFEKALSLARTERWKEAVETLFPVVQANPFDGASRALLTLWGRHSERS